jgi:hypothetical protein
MLYFLLLNAVTYKHVILSVVECGYVFSSFFYENPYIILPFHYCKNMFIFQRLQLKKNQSSLPLLVQEDVWMESLLKIRMC